MNNDALQSYFAEIGLTGPHDRAEFGSTALHIAAIHGRLNALAWLLDAGADINAAGESQYTALHEAVEQEQHEVIRFLLARGASTAAIEEDGLDPLGLALVREDQQTAAILRNHAA